jgi:creatinine amidohydrolase
MTRARHWHELSTVDFKDRITARTVAVLPVAAIEQHGPHLPVGVDFIIGQGHADDVARHLPEDVDALFLPVQPVGKSNEHLFFPGTLTLTWQNAINAWLDIGESVARAGCRRLVIVTSHGGNVAMIDIIARELRVRHRMLAVHTAWSRLGKPPGLFSDREGAFGIHGGDYETSLMLAFRPDLVRMDRARDFASRGEGYAGAFKHLRVTQPAGFGWMSQDLNPAGVVGEAHLATPEKGLATIAHVRREFTALLRDVMAFDLANLDKGPLES